MIFPAAVKFCLPFSPWIIGIYTKDELNVACYACKIWTDQRVYTQKRSKSFNPVKHHKHWKSDGWWLHELWKESKGLYAEKKNLKTPNCYRLLKESGWLSCFLVITSLPWNKSNKKTKACEDLVKGEWETMFGSLELCCYVRGTQCNACYGTSFASAWEILSLSYRGSIRCPFQCYALISSFLTKVQQ